MTSGTILRATWWWGVLSALAYLTRMALDWFVPTESFSGRAEATTYAAIALFLAAGFVTAWRTRSALAGMLAGIATGVISAVLIVAGSLVMLAMWHDERTLTAIQQSGGLGELFELPILVIVPGTLIAALGGVLAKGAELLRGPAASIR